MILAVDMGSTSFKAGLFDNRLRLRSAGSAPLRHRFGPGGQVETDAAAVEAALRGALEAAGARRQAIRIIALTSQAQTFAWVDRRGRPLTPFFSWQDTRSATECRRLAATLPGFARHCSFWEPLPGLQLCQLRRLRRQAPAGGMPLLLPSYVLRLWTGESATDNNIAAMSGLFSLAENAWWPDALRACGLRAGRLPRVVPVGRVAGLTTSAARRHGLAAGIPVILAGNDQTAGAYAARLDTTSSLLITLGTAQVAYACRATLPPPRPGTIRGPYPGNRAYRMAADSAGGSVINWARTVLAGCGDNAAFFRHASRAPAGCHGLEFEAGLDLGRGTWTNLALHHTSADLARSILESLTRRMTGLVASLGRRHRPAKAFVAGGGGTQPLWRSMLSSALDIRLVPITDGPLAGAARMAQDAVANTANPPERKQQ